MLYAVPTVAQRRESRAARAAYIAYAITTFHLLPHERIFCMCCARERASDWCNTCEILGNRPVPNQPQLITPYCNACMDADVECTICGVRPLNGPADADFAPQNLGNLNQIQIAGALNGPNTD